MEKICQGAEAIIMTDDGNVIKERISKGYRIKEIDEQIRKRRTRAEASVMREARSLGILTPQIYDIGKYSIEMEFISGPKLKDVLNELDSKTFSMVCSKMGEYAALLHGADIIHGDLTTSNFILCKNKVFLIDFGLSFHSKRPEDKALDLHLLHQALQAAHFKILKGAWEIILNAYAANYVDANIITERLRKIEARGRYK